MLCLNLLVGCDTHNSPPALLPIEEQLWLVNSTNSLELFARDQEGGTLRFDFMMDPLPQVFTEGALGQPTLTPLTQNQALFQWAPSLRDIGAYSVTFTVSDGQELSTSETIRIEVYSPSIGDQAALRFIQPAGAGESLDLSQTSCLELDVRVNADGIPPEDILIDFTEPLVEGADFIPSGTFTGKERRLSWCPSSEQQNVQDRYTFNLRARRRQGEEWSTGVTKRYLVRLESQGGDDESCIGRPPSVQHEPPLEASGTLDYQILINVYDDLGIKSSPLLALWTQGEPLPESVSDSRWSLIEFDRVSSTENQWIANIPNLNLELGQTKTLYYAVIVTDNDDPNGARCDHTVESPIYPLNISGSGDLTALSLCTPCATNDQCGGPIDLCLTYEEGTYCGRHCDAQNLCDLGYECLALDTSNGIEVQQCVPESLSCTTTCSPDRFDQEEETLITYQVAPLLTEGTFPNLSLCGESYDLYQIEIPAQHGLEVDVTFDHTAIDIDIAIALEHSQENGQPLMFDYESTLSDQPQERIQLSCLNNNEEMNRAWVIVYPYQQDMVGAYTMNLRTPSGGCGMQCQDDVLEQQEPVIINDGLYENLTLCPADDDLFLIELEAGVVMSAFADFDLSQGDLDLSLYAEDGQVIQTDLGVRQGAWIEWRSAEDGQYLLSVTGANASVSNHYSLDLYLYPTLNCESTIDCPATTFCYPQLGCLDAACSPELTCGPYHSCIYPVDLNQGSEGQCRSDCYTDGMCREGEGCKLLSDGSGACIDQGTQELGHLCGQHSDCAGGKACVEVDQQFVCVDAGCEWVSCSDNTVCVTEINESYCLPRCELGCPPSWSCREFNGTESCRPLP